MTTGVSLAFLGGCVAATLIFAPKLWNPRWLLGGLLAAVVAAYVVYSTGVLKSYAHIRLTPANLQLLSAQMAVWLVAGVSILALVVLDLRRHRDASALLLALWIGGTFLFAGDGPTSWRGRGR